MYRQVLESAEHIEIWPVISLIIFFTFFIGILVFVIRTDKKYIKKMEGLPLEDGTTGNKNQKTE